MRELRVANPEEAPAWNEETLFSSGDDFFRALLTSIADTRRSVEMEVFIFRDDRLGREVANALRDAALRGVRVRVLLDGLGSWRLGAALQAELVSSGVDLRFYHPLPWHSGAEGWTAALGTLNSRNHRKLWILDHEIAYLGSMNVTEVHCESYSGPRAWRDVGVRLRGAPLLWLRAAFESTWQAKARAREWRRLADRAPELGPARAGRNLVELNLSRATRRRKNQQLAERIESARHRVVLVNPYFVPSWSLLRALKNAARRGVSVRVLVPERSDVPLMSFLSRQAFGRLLGYGVEIHEYRSFMLHAKITLIDDWLRVGSSNLNQRSLLHDLELNVVLQKRSSIHEVEAILAGYLRNCSRLRREEWERRGWLARFAELTLYPIRTWF